MAAAGPVVKNIIYTLTDPILLRSVAKLRESLKTFLTNKQKELEKAKKTTDNENALAYIKEISSNLEKFFSVEQYDDQEICYISIPKSFVPTLEYFLKELPTPEERKNGIFEKVSFGIEEQTDDKILFRRSEYICKSSSSIAAVAVCSFGITFEYGLRKIFEIDYFSDEKKQESQKCSEVPIKNENYVFKTSNPILHKIIDVELLKAMKCEVFYDVKKAPWEHDYLINNIIILFTKDNYKDVSKYLSELGSKITLKDPSIILYGALRNPIIDVSIDDPSANDFKSFPIKPASYKMPKDKTAAAKPPGDFDTHFVFFTGTKGKGGAEGLSTIRDTTKSHFIIKP